MFEFIFKRIGDRDISSEGYYRDDRVSLAEGLQCSIIFPLILWTIIIKNRLYLLSVASAISIALLIAVNKFIFWVSFDPLIDSSGILLFIWLLLLSDDGDGTWICSLDASCDLRKPVVWNNNLLPCV